MKFEKRCRKISLRIFCSSIFPSGFEKVCGRNVENLFFARFLQSFPMFCSWRRGVTFWGIKGDIRYFLSSFSSVWTSMKEVFDWSVHLDKRFSSIVKVFGKCRVIDECVVSNGRDCLLEMKCFRSTRLTRFLCFPGWCYLFCFSAI